MINNIKKIFLLFVIIISTITVFNCSERKNNYEGKNSEYNEDEISDGIYDATITTSSGSYDVEVTVEDGEVTYVHWPNGGDMSVSDATIYNMYAVGTNSRGDEIEIEIH